MLIHLTLVEALLGLGSLLSFLIWTCIYFHPGMAWKLEIDTGDVPKSDVSSETTPSVAVIVPCRNEADILPDTLPALIRQKYDPMKLTIIVVNNNSQDRTFDIAQALAVFSDVPVQVLQAPPTPAGWVGKVWAMEEGLRWAQEQDHFDYFLFTDADILHQENSLITLVAEAERDSLALNSRLARLHCASPAEKFLLPPFVFFFNLIYPTRWIASRRHSCAAAAGGCVLLHRQVIERLRSLAPIRNEIIDDVNLARAVKRQGLNLRLRVSAGQVTSLRQYHTLENIGAMVRRTAYRQLLNSPLVLTFTLALLLLTFAVPVLGLIGGTMLPHTASLVGINAVTLFAMMCCFWPTLSYFRLSFAYGITLPAAALCYGAFTIQSAIQHHRGDGLRWREIPPINDPCSCPRPS